MDNSLYTTEDVNDAWYAYMTDYQASGEGISPQEMIDSLEPGPEHHATYGRGKRILEEAGIVKTAVSGAPPSSHLAKDIGPVDSPKLVRDAGYSRTGMVALYQVIALRKRDNSNPRLSATEAATE